MSRFYLILADAILVLHMLIVLFILVGFVVIWVGYFRGWDFVRNFGFRVVHLLAMGFVAVQTVLGADCPLTIWENALRLKGGTASAYEETFVGHWLGRILFYELDLAAFAVLYSLFFLLIVFTWIWVRPVRPGRRRSLEQSAGLD